MFRFMGRLIRWSIGATLVGIVAVSLIGAGRVKAAFVSVREHLRSNVDELVDARVALRGEIEGLSKDYPKRIAELKSQLSEIDRDLGECEEQRRVSTEVVTLCRGDVEVLKSGLTALTHDGDTLSFRGERLSAAETERRAARIAETAEAYDKRLADLGKERALLADERERIRSELASTENECREFELTARAMLREIDALSRQEKVVKMVELRDRRQEDPLSGRATALAEVKERIDRRRTELSERMRMLEIRSDNTEYESRARLNLASK